MNILVIDPGPHVGVACYVTESETRGWWAFEQTPEELYENAQPWAEWADVVVVEDFRISGPRASEANATIEMIGVLRYLAGRAGTKFVVQTPTDAMTFVSNEKLKRLEMWTKGSDHARSATKHLVLYLARSGVLGAELLPSADAEGGTAT